MPDDSTPEPSPDDPLPPPEAPPDLRPLYHSDAVRHAEAALFNAIARSTRDAIIATPIEGRHIYFTGSVPFAQEHLEHWVETLGAFATPDRLDPEFVEWLVLGRANYDVDLVDSLIMSEVQFFSQEEFLSLVLLGEDATVRNRIDAEANPHPGLQLVEQLESAFWDDFEANSLDDFETESEPFPDGENEPGGPRWFSVSLPLPSSQQASDLVDTPNWSAIPDEPGHEPYDNSADLKVESELKKLGYSVAKYVNLPQRQYALDLCVQRLGLTKVVNHLRWLIYFQRNNPHQQRALTKWREDLDWLRSHYGT